MKHAPTGISTLLVFLVIQSGVVAQTVTPGDVLKRLDALTETLSSLTKHIAELTSLLKAALPPSPVEEITPVHLDIGQAPMRGATAARIVLIEFSDFECPFCGRHAQGAYRDLQRQFVDTGKIKYVFRHLPIEPIHPSAMKAAEAAECAGEQGKFWEMHDRIFANQRALAVSELRGYAPALGVDSIKFHACLEEGKMASKVKADLAEAERLGLTATPAFLMGELQIDGRVRVTRKIMGAQPFQVFQAALETFLTKQ